MIADDTIVRDMAIGHEQIIGADDGFVYTVASTTTHGNKLKTHCQVR